MPAKGLQAHCYGFPAVPFRFFNVYGPRQRAGDAYAAVVPAFLDAALAEAGFEVTPATGRGSAPAEEFLVNGGPARVGIVGSVTKPFCAACDRVRLTADGQWRSCLFAAGERDLRTPLRAGAGKAELAGLMSAEVKAKKPGHGLDDPGFLQPDRPMSAIGG